MIFIAQATCFREENVFDDWIGAVYTSNEKGACTNPAKLNCRYFLLALVKVALIRDEDCAESLSRNISITLH